jgi:coenzyme F420-reducing hydrogenase delta subunit
MLLRMLRQLGLGEARCRFDFVAANEGERFAAIAARMVSEVRRLGPLSLTP